MRNLKTLIKIHQTAIDNTLKSMSQMNGAKDLMEKRLNQLLEDMASEAEKFSSTEYGFALDQYLKGARVARDKLDANILNLEQKIHDAELLLHDQFSELKKFEIALKNREAVQSKAESMAELKEQDNINIMRFV